MITAIVARLLLAEVQPEQLTPPLWVIMGATAITLLAGASIADLPHALGTSVFSPTFAGMSLVLWAFGTWWIPLLIVLGAWRHLVRRVPLTYDPTLWSMVFPLGMFAVSSEEFGRVEHFRLLVSLGTSEIWIALAVWLAIFAGLLLRLAAMLRQPL